MLSRSEALESCKRWARLNVRLVKRTGGGRCLLDLGANIGEVARECSPLFDKVVAVEANPRTFDFMRRRLTKIKNVRTIRAAVAKKSGQTYYVSNPNHYSCAARATPEKWGRERPKNYYSRVRTRGFRELLSATRADVVKMDIEGGEYEVLDGSRLPWVKTIIVEFHFDADLRRSRSVIKKMSRQFSAELIGSHNPRTKWSLNTVVFSRRGQRG